MSLPTYTKPHLPVSDQLRLLESRGLVVTDRPRAVHCLERIGYYRLSGYWYPFRESQPAVDASGVPFKQVLDQFRPGTTFGRVMDLYVFDKRLRLLFLDAIERIEVTARVQIALLLSGRNPLAHRQPSQLHGHFSKKVNAKTGMTGHQAWLNRLADNERRSKEDFILHFRSRYSSDLPIWIAIELDTSKNRRIYSGGVVCGAAGALRHRAAGAGLPIGTGESVPGTAIVWQPLPTPTPTPLGR